MTSIKIGNFSNSFLSYFNLLVDFQLFSISMIIDKPSIGGR